MTISDLYDIYLKHPGVQTDTRQLKKGDLFFALKGPNFDANTLAVAALEAGAAYAVIDDPKFHIPPRTILVDNVLETLQTLAKFHRETFQIPFLAITGTNGKTTTKELISQVLRKKLVTYTTKGNLNNHIGIPLTLLSIQKDAEIAVIEMGANHQHEIEAYCTYTLPTHGLITNCGKAHLEGFGGEEGVRKGKGELFDYLRETGGTAFIMNDYEYLREMSKGIKTVVTYGTANAEITGKLTGTDPYLQARLRVNDEIYEVETNLVGDYNLPNVLAAVAAGSYFGVPVAKQLEALKEYNPVNSRSQLIEKGSNKIIMDAYNANPSSMKASLENFAQIKAEHKVVLLGAMMELGNESVEEHKWVVQLLKKLNFNKVVLVGGDFEGISQPFIYMKNSLEAAQWLREQQFTGASILIKGSRNVQMEKLLGAL